VNVRVEEDQTGKIYHVQVLTDDQGKQKVIEKTYDSRLEMESDTLIEVQITGESIDPDYRKTEEEVFVSRGKNGDLVIRSGSSGILHEEEIKDPFSGKPRKLEAKINDISMNDAEFSDFGLEDLRQLKLKSLNYFPNPNEGEFNLAFTGKRKPVIVRILDPGGNLKYENAISDFDGNFSRMINLKSFEPGTYLLQIHQQGKVLNRKITVD
jgi:hypothetical protein